MTTDEPVGSAAQRDGAAEHEPPAAGSAPVPAPDPGPAEHAAPAGSTVPPETAAPLEPARWPIAVALLNLTGLSFGYGYLGRWRRAVLYLAITTGLLVAAFATDAARQPWLWRGIFAAWAVWMAFDGWRLARRHPEARTAPRRRPALVATAAVLAVAAGYVVYGAAGDRTFASGVATQAAGDCAKATTRYDLVTGPFELTLNGDATATAEQNRAYCSQFLVPVARHDRREFESAIAGYREFLDRTPATSLDGPAHDRIQRAYLEWAQSAKAAGDYPTAVKTYLDLLENYGEAWSTQQARSELAQALLDEAQLLRSRFAKAGDVAVIDVREAMQNYLLIQKDFGDTEAAASVPQAIVDTFDEAIRPFTSGKYCEAAPALEYLASMPADNSAGVVPTAQQHHGKAAFECGLLRYGAGKFHEAAKHFEAVTKYSGHALASAAGSAYIAATIAIQKPGTIPAIPPPLGDNTPGSIRLTFFNDTSSATEVLVLGPTAHRFVVPGCPSCPVAYTNDAEACVTEAGKPRFELRLRPGDYFVINREADYPENAAEVTTIALRGPQTRCMYQLQES